MNFVKHGHCTAKVTFITCNKTDREKRWVDFYCAGNRKPISEITWRMSSGSSSYFAVSLRPCVPPRATRNKLMICDFIRKDMKRPKRNKCKWLNKCLRNLTPSPPAIPSTHSSATNCSISSSMLWTCILPLRNRQVQCPDIRSHDWGWFFFSGKLTFLPRL